MFALLLTTLTAAFGGTLEAGEVVELASPPVWVAALPRADMGAILIGTEAEVRILDPATGRQTDSIEGRYRDAVAVDIDGNGTRELVLCGEGGVRTLPWESATTAGRISDTDCSAVEVVYAKETLLVTATDALHLWSVDGPLADRGRFGDALEKPVRMVAHRDLLAVVEDDGSQLVEWGPAGRRVLEADGPIDGFARYGDDWAWTTSSGITAEGRVFAGATALAAGNAADLHILHPELSILGTLNSGVETAISLPFGARWIAVADLDADTDADVVVGDGSQLVILRSNVGSAPLEPRGPDLLNTTRGATDPINLPSARVHSLNIPLFLGTDGNLASGRVPPEVTMIGGVGVTVGSALLRGLQGGGSPAFIAAMESVYSRGVRWHFGMDSSPTFTTITTRPRCPGGRCEEVTWHLALLNSGVTFGSAHLRTGVFGTFGLYGMGFGSRTVWAPFETRGGIVHGFEVRLWDLWDPRNGIGKRITRSTGAVTLAYVTALPMGRGRSFDDTLPGISARPPEARPQSLVMCRRFAVAIGAGAGLSSTDLSWTHIGQNSQWDPTWSPAVSVACESGEKTAGLVYAIDSVPFFHYRVPWNGGTRDQQLRHMGTATIGGVIGTDVFRGGPFVTGGIWAAGAGLRAVFTPFGGPGDRAHHGVELRATALHPPGEAGEGLLLYTFWWDPRR